MAGGRACGAPGLCERKLRQVRLHLRVAVLLELLEALDLVALALQLVLPALLSRRRLLHQLRLVLQPPVPRDLAALQLSLLECCAA